MAGNWLNIAGGAAQGFVQGREDIRKSDEAEMRKKEFDSLQKQRKRVEDEQAKDDAQEAEQKRVRVAGKYTDLAPRAGTAEAQPGFVGPPSGTKEVTVTPGQEARERAAVAGRSGRTKDLQLQQGFQTQATALDQAARVEKVEQAKSVLAEAGRLRATGNLAGAARLMQAEYAKHPDGHEIVLGEENGVQTIGVAGPDGKYVQQPVPLTAAAVDAMIAQGHNLLNSENFYKGQELGIKRQELDYHKITAEAAATNAQANLKRALFDAGEDAQKARQALIDYHKEMAAIERMKAGAAVNANRWGPSIAFTDAEGRPQYGAVSTKGDKPQFVPLAGVPEGWTPVGDLSASQKAKLELHKEKVKSGGYKTPIEEQAALDDILRPGGGFFGTLNKGDPAKQVGPPAPTPAEKAAANKPPRKETPQQKKDREEMERQKKKFLTPGKPPQTTPAELDAQLSAQVEAANRR